MFEASNKDYPKQPVTCRFYEAKSNIDPKGSMYLKFLRHLGKKHSSIIHTWEIFVDNEKNIEIFQEYCSIGNLQDYCEKKSLKEKEITLYAWQLLRGMDFLGDIGIAHRDIKPKNLVLRPTTEFNLLKIANFRKAIIYWSIEDNDVIFIPCLPAKQQATDGANFQAPEVYGDSNKEEFDPIVADTWSFGAVIHFMSSKKYPYDPTKQSNNIVEEIQKNIKNQTILSDDGKQLLSEVLQTNAAERMPIGFIEKCPWFESIKQV